jgi:hypothetical protein
MMSDPAYGLMHKQTLHNLVKENERLRVRLADQDERWRQLEILAKTQTVDDSPEAFVHEVIVKAQAARA